MSRTDFCPEDQHMCCLCFHCFPIEALWVDEQGQRWDICLNCKALDDALATRITDQ
jgi:hypothetical protein